MRASCDRSLSPSPSVCPKISVLTTAPTLCPGSDQAHTWTISSSSRHHHHHHHHHNNKHHHHTPPHHHRHSGLTYLANNLWPMLWTDRSSRTLCKKTRMMMAMMMMMNHEGRVTSNLSCLRGVHKTDAELQNITNLTIRVKLVKKWKFRHFDLGRRMKMIFTPSGVRKCVDGLASKFLHIVPVPINVQNIIFVLNFFSLNI